MEMDKAETVVMTDHKVVDVEVDQGGRVNINYFEKLPIEMAEMILNNLDFKSRMSAREVCGYFKKVVDGTTKVTFRLCDDSLDIFLAMDNDREIDTLMVEGLMKKPSSMSQTRSGLLNKVRHLYFRRLPLCRDCEDTPMDEVSTIRHHGPNFCNLGQSTSEQNLLGILRLHPEIQRLSFGPMALRGIQHPGAMQIKDQFESLTCIEICLGDFDSDMLIHDRTSVTPYRQFLKNKFSFLKTFIFDNKACGKPIDLLLSVYEFVARHHETLKILQITSLRRYGDSILSINQQKWAPRVESIMQKLTKVQLECVNLRTTATGATTLYPVGLSLADLEICFLSAQKSLQFASLSFIDFDSMQLARFIDTCSYALRSLRVGNNAMHLSDTPFDCSMLQNCNKLEYLDIDIDNQDWAWFTPRARTPSKIENIHYLPPSITKIRIEGYLPESKYSTMIKGLPRLQTFWSAGYGHSGKSVDLMKIAVMNSNIEVLQIDNDNSKPTRLVRNRLLHLAGISPMEAETPGGFKLLIDRKVFDPKSLPAIPNIFAQENVPLF